MRDIFYELLSIKEPQTTLQNKETIVESYQLMSNQNTKKRPGGLRIGKPLENIFSFIRIKLNKT